MLPPSDLLVLSGLSFPFTAFTAVDKFRTVLRRPSVCQQCDLCRAEMLPATSKVTISILEPELGLRRRGRRPRKTLVSAATIWIPENSSSSEIQKAKLQIKKQWT